MKKILILGGARAQVPLIEAAKKEGYYVVLCDWTTTNPGIALADKHYQVSTLDLEAVLSVAKKEQVNGVISNSEPAMGNVAAIAAELGLVGTSVESVEKLQSKYNFRCLQKKAEVFSPEAVEDDDLETFIKKVQTLHFPIVIKPSKSSASRGTTRIEQFDPTIIRDAFQDCKDFSSNKKVVGEEYLDMPSRVNIEADVFIYHDTILWDGIFSNIRSTQFPVIPQTYVFPSFLTETQKDQFERVVSRLLKEAGFSYGEVNVEGYFTNEDKLFIVEINVRQGGCSIPKLLYEHCGVDFYKLLVTSCMGEDEYWCEVCSSTRSYRFVTNYVLLPNQDGKYNGICIENTLAPFVHNIEIRAAIGASVHKTRNATDALGMISFEFRTREEQLFFSTNLSEYIQEKIL